MLCGIVCWVKVVITAITEGIEDGHIVAHMFTSLVAKSFIPRDRLWG
jgi:hypothetical protein